jgi:hypothetical protein
MGELHVKPSLKLISMRYANEIEIIGLTRPYWHPLLSAFSYKPFQSFTEKRPQTPYPARQSLATLRR